MMKFRQKILFLTLLFFLFPVFLTAKKSKTDLKLSEIDRLIKRTEYDKALNLLNFYMMDNPDNFDNAQLRIKKIMNARQQYALLADRLIQLIKNEPENNKAIYEITAQLEKFERHPSSQNLQFIADVKKSAQFNYFRYLFVQIQTEAAELAKNGEYLSAMHKLKEGFWLYKDDFYEKWENKPQFLKTSDSILDELDKNMLAFESRDYFQKTNDSTARFLQSLKNSDMKNSLLLFSEVQKNFNHLYELREKIRGQAEAFKSLMEATRLAGDDDSSDASFLPFMTRFISGIESIEKSGILGVFDFYSRDLCSRMNGLVFEQLTLSYDEYCALQKALPASDEEEDLGQQTMELNPGQAQKIRQLAELQDRIINLYPEGFEEYKILSAYLMNLTNQTEYFKGVKNQIVQTFIEEEKAIEALSDPSSQKESKIREIFNFTQKIARLTGQERDHNLLTADWAGDYKLLSRNDWLTLSLYYSDLLALVYDDARKMDLLSWTWIARFYNQQSNTFISDARIKNEAANKFLQGLDRKIAALDLKVFKKDLSLCVNYALEKEMQGEEEVLYCYPDLAEMISARNQSDIEESIKTVRANKSFLLDFYEASPVWINDEDISQICRDNQNYLQINLDMLSQLQKDGKSILDSSNAKILTAKLSKNEGDLRYSESLAAFKNKDFQTARKKLQDALSKYQLSLANQEDEELRQNCDKKLFDLAGRITSGENEYVVVEVRRLKNLAKDAYFNGRFEDAEKYLRQANIRWHDTNIDEDPEIANLMTFVNTAVSMQTGREISPSSPQYPEMSQLLDISYRYYDSGSQKIAAGDTKAGGEDLEKALNSIQKLQYVYPLNQEASILTLKINRLKDPKKFKEEFSQKIEAARFMCKNQESRREGYSNLLDYYALEPSYPGLKDLIYQTEIEIGIRQKPADNSSQKQAQNLYAEARKLYNSSGNDRSKLELALKTVNQSLSLNSESRDAAKLKDEIMTKIGGTTSTVLSTEDEHLYQLAIQRLQSNNISGANAIVARLMQNSRNLNSQKIKDLKVKIDARL